MYKRVLYSTFCCFLAVGCGPKSSIKTVPVTGVVMYQGKPLEAAQVGFVDTVNPDALPAHGYTDAAGKFTISTSIGGTKTVAGAVPGSYTVIVTKVEQEAGQGSMPTSPEEAARMGAQQQNESREKLMEQMKSGKGKPSGDVMLTPEKYASAKSSDLKVTVKESGNEPITLELKDE